MNFPKPSEGGEGVELKEGWYLAIFQLVAYMGTVENTYNNQTTHYPTIAFTWEIPGVKLSDGRPATKTTTCSYLFASKSTYTKLMNGLAGRTLSKEEIMGINPSKLIGRGCLLNIGKSETGRDKVITLAPPQDPVSKQPYDIPSLVNEPVVYSVLEHNKDSFELLYPFLQDDIKTSPEYIERFGGSQVQTQDLPQGVIDAMAQQQNVAAPPTAQTLPNTTPVQQNTADPLAGLTPASQIKQPPPRDPGFLGDSQPKQDSDDLPF